MEDLLKQLLSDVSEIKNEVSHLRTEIIEIKIILNQEIKENCNKMKDHIDFVDNLYDNVKAPMEFFINKINTVTGNEHLSLNDRIINKE